MAKDFVKVLEEIRGTGEPEASGTGKTYDRPGPWPARDSQVPSI